MTSPLKMVCGCALIMIAFLFQAVSASAADQLTKIQVPNVPFHLTTPSSIRLSHWKQVQGLGDQFPVLWKMIDEMEAPILVKGFEFVENTPDVFSGAYYSYHLYRTLILFIWH